MTWVLDATVLVALGRRHALDLLTVLDDDPITGDAAVIASVIDADGTIGVVSDDERIRTIASGLGADVTGTIGVVVHAVRRGQIAADDAKGLVRDIDRRGLHMTGSLRDTADRLIDGAADDAR